MNRTQQDSRDTPNGLRAVLTRCQSLILWLFLCVAGSVVVTAQETSPPYIHSHVPRAVEVGSGRLTFLFWEVYDARLFATEGKWYPERPFALSLTYLMDLDGEAIADRSVEEMRKQGINDEEKLAEWHRQMRQLFPDVSENTTLTGVFTAKGESLFYLNGILRGKVTDPDFGNAFFAIWLSEKTTEPGLRRKLLGV